MALSPTDDGMHFYTVNEIASLMGLSRNTIYRAIQIGTLPSIRIGRVIRIQKTELDKFLLTETANIRRQPGRAHIISDKDISETSHLSLYEAAMKLNVAPSTIRYHRIRKGIPSQRRMLVSDDDIIRTARMTGPEAAKELNLAQITVYNRRSRLGLVNRRRHISDSEIAEEYKQTLSRSKVAAGFGLSYCTISRRLRRYEDVTGERLPKPSSNWHEHPRVVEIFETYDKIRNLRLVGEMFGISSERVRQIVDRFCAITGRRIATHICLDCGSHNVEPIKHERGIGNGRSETTVNG